MLAGWHETVDATPARRDSGQVGTDFLATEDTEKRVGYGNLHRADLFSGRRGDIVDKSSLRLQYDRKREIKGQTQKMDRTPLITVL